MTKPLNREKCGRIRIALLGNMNNNHFAMLRYLRDRGFDCTLLLFNNEFDHFHPKCDTYNLDFRSWIKQLDWGAAAQVASISVDHIKFDVCDYDLFIGTGYAAAFMHRAGLSLDIMDPYGYDVWQATFYGLAAPHYLRRHLVAAYHQRRGIATAKIIHTSFGSTAYGKRLNTLSPNAEVWNIGVPMVYAPEYKLLNIQQFINKTHWGEEFATIRRMHQFVVIAHGRHVWGNHTDPNAKGNKSLIEGWSLFCDRNPTVTKQLVFMEYGQNVLDSKNYIAELRLGHTVTWFPKMYRKDLMPGLLMSDLVAGEFVHSWIASGVLYEALVAGKPILTYRNEELHASEYPCLYPIYNAQTPEQIANCMQECFQNPKRSQEIGLLGQAWYEQEVVIKAIEKYTEYIEYRAKMLGKSVY